MTAVSGCHLTKSLQICNQQPNFSSCTGSCLLLCVHSKDRRVLIGRWCLRTILGPVLARRVINALDCLLPQLVKGYWVTAQGRVGHLLPGLQHIQKASLWAAYVCSVVTCNDKYGLNMRCF